MDYWSMNKEVEEILKRCKDILELKGHDYANKEDRLRNFKNVARVFSSFTGKEIKSVEAAFFLVLLKLDRYMNLYRSGVEAKNEPIRDTVVDLINYVLLMEMCRLEEVGEE